MAHAMHPDRVSETDAFDSGLNLFFMAAFPLLLWLLDGSIVTMLSGLILIFLFAAALRLISRGQQIARDFEARENAPRPRVPRKILGSLLIGVMVAMLAGQHSASFALPLLLGAVGAGLSLTAFGLDPLKAKGTGLAAAPLLSDSMAAGGNYASDIEDELIELSERVAGLGDAALTLQTDAACKMVMRILRTLGSDSRGLKNLKKPLAKFMQIFAAEVARLEAAWRAGDTQFARKLYAGKIKVLAESFEERALRGGKKSGRDAFDMQADMLLERMPSENAA